MQTLILNQHYQPHRVTSWQDAITELFTDKIEIIEWYDEVIYHNAERGVTMKMPAVGRLIKHISAYKKGVKFSRINLMSRDQFRCQYCGTRFRMNDLTYDHVIPRSHGGKTDWHNVSASCRVCNSAKRDRTPEQAGMKLLRKPFRPKVLPLGVPMLSMREIPAEWQPYVQDRE